MQERAHKMIMLVWWFSWHELFAGQDQSLLYKNLVFGEENVQKPG